MLVVNALWNRTILGRNRLPKKTAPIKDLASPKCAMPCSQFLPKSVGSCWRATIAHV